MKIYATRADDTLSTLQKLVGSGDWILVDIFGTPKHDVMYVSGRFYISPVELDKTTCRMQMCSSYGYGEWPEAIDLREIRWPKYEYLDCIHIHKPVEILTHDEFFEPLRTEEE